ncbi:MAG: PstS family phosphate ABC transporter substrate-binding protein [Acidimicrobiales bacterium]
MTKFLRALVLLFTFTLVAAACGSDDGDTESGGESSDSGAEGGGDAGEIVISGSSTVEPISINVAEAYREIEPDVNISVTGPGTGDGFKAFCAGETDISDASRAIKDEEATDCEANGISYVELKVGIDGIAVMTSSENTAVACLSFGDLYALVGPESTGFATWADANEIAGEVGNGGLPDAELVISAPGTESGTYDSFVEIVLEDLADERGQEATTRPDYSSAADDNVIIETISSNPTSFGWVGFAFAEQASDVTLIPISAEAGGDCIEANPETIASNEYPIARDLFIYVNTGNAAESEALANFVDYYMTYGLDEATAAAKYVPLTEDSKTETRAAWDGR